MDRNYAAITFISNMFILRRSRVANFADMIKIAVMFIKKTYNESKIAKKLETIYYNTIYIYTYMLMSVELKGCIT